MTQLSTPTQKPKAFIPVLILTWLSFVLVIFVSLPVIRYLANCMEYWDSDGSRVWAGYYITTLLIHFAPVVLFLLCLTVFRKKNKAAILIPIIFVLTGGYQILHTLNAGTSLYFPLNEHYLFVSFLPLLASGFAAFSMWKVSLKKPALIIALLVGILFHLLTICDLVMYLLGGFMYEWNLLYVLQIPGHVLLLQISLILLYIALFVFCWNNREISPSAPKALPADPEQALLFLNQQLASGKISPEDYTIRRNEIIRNL